LISQDVFGSGNAPTFASQKMIFSIPLTQVGADFYDALIKGATGVPVTVALTYGGLTPPAGFTVHVNWDLTYQHYSSDSKFAARASYWGLWGGSVNSERQEIFDELKKSGAVKVDVITGSGFSMDQIDKYLQPILARINAEMIENLKPPDKLSPAAAPDPSAGGFFGSAGYSVSVKSATEHRSGVEDVSFNVRNYEERVTVASGFIGIGGYPDEVKAKLVTTAPLGSWDKAYFLFPTMFNDPRLRIQAATIQIGLTDGTSDIARSIYQWKPDKDWSSPANGITIQWAAIPLAGLKAKLGDDTYAKLKFRLKLDVVQEDSVLSKESSFPLFNGQTALGSLPDLIDKVGIDATTITFNQVQSNSPLDSIAFKVTSLGHTCSDTIRPRATDDGKRIPPQVVYCAIPKGPTGAEPIEVFVSFAKTDGTIVAWKHNGDVKKDNSVVDIKDIVLRDSDWK
jgi:hypothetical protein